MSRRAYRTHLQVGAVRPQGESILPGVVCCVAGAVRCGASKCLVSALFTRYSADILFDFCKDLPSEYGWLKNLNAGAAHREKGRGDHEFDPVGAAQRA